MKLINNITLHKEYAKVQIKSKNSNHIMLIDTEDLMLLDKVRVTNTGYAYNSIAHPKYKASISNIIMQHTPNRTIVIDHINANKLDNRKQNLREITQQGNTQARKTFIRCNTNAIGIAYRTHPKWGYNYYRVSITNPITKKRYTKQFNIRKMGKTNAFHAAKKHLAAKKQEYGYIS